MNKNGLNGKLVEAVLFGTVFFLSLTITACSKNNGRAGEVEDGVFYGSSIMSDAKSAPMMMKMATVKGRNASFAAADFDDVEMEMEEAYSDADYGTAYNPEGPGNGKASGAEAGSQNGKEFERKLIKNGNVTLQVQDLSEGESAVENWCKELGGYISHSSSDEYSAYFTVKIPSASFEKAMETVGDFGVVKNRNVSSQDVSEQYYDLKTRLETKKVLQTNLKNYLAQAANITDILKIERELNNVTSDIESMEGQLRRLSNQIDYSTISISLILPQGKTDPVIQPPTFSEKVKSFLFQVKAFFVKVGLIILYAIVCGVPCLAIIALLYWLLFGKLGFIKKLIKRLK